MSYSEKWGTSVDEAVKLALSDLKATMDEVEVTVLEEPSKGFFGIGNKLAKVRVSIKSATNTVVYEATEQKKEQKTETKVESIKEPSMESPIGKKVPEERVIPTEKAVEKSVEKKREDIKPLLQAKPEDLQDLTEHPALTFIKDTIDSMGLKMSVKASGNEEFVFLELEGEDTGTIIGKRGQTLDAIQYLTSLVVNKGKEEYVRVVIDAENYRAKREKTLQQLADRLAEKVARSKRPMKLEPMNPYERKVIHSTLQNHPKVVTRSEGEEPYRRVIIELKNKG
jgi:spoIIIJ-associated protein